ncbi:MAG: S-adenosylmethionine synthetase N-terminal domain-containing protein [Alphaproteobacteria bacterium]
MQRTAEAVSLGHPDKTADYISSFVLDKIIEQDPNVRYAVEVMIKDNTVVLGGEISSSARLDKPVYRKLCAMGISGITQ